MERDEYNPFKRTLAFDCQGSKKRKIVSLSKSRSSLPREPKPVSKPTAITATTTDTTSLEPAPADKTITKDTISIDSTLVEYACPICNKDLSNVKSSYMRQKHVEVCMENTTKEKEDDDDSDSFEDCMFCAKVLSHLSLTARTIHLNTCLDNIKEPVEFAGQKMPFLETLSVCPVCYETMKTKLKQKITHIKQCRRQHGISIAQLVQKFRWIGWGHSFVSARSPQSAPASLASSQISSPRAKCSPIASSPIASSPIASSPMINSPVVSSRASNVTYTSIDNTYHATLTYEDNDFSNQVVISRANASLLPKPKEEMDEELQMTLALSRSMQPDAQKRRTLKRTDERDLNSANVWSIEESKQKVFEKLDSILFPEQEERTPLASTKLGKSKFMSQETFFWNLASNKELNWDHFLFVCDFIQPFKKVKTIPA
ncbi:hypothetical protein G6F56_001869 [Rhizopus delemar]|nr:hypothetical protein G6F56_001869 [Rhizopus delemar]